jgi:hypothetical protein
MPLTNHVSQPRLGTLPTPQNVACSTGIRPCSDHAYRPATARFRVTSINFFLRAPDRARAPASHLPRTTSRTLVRYHRRGHTHTLEMPFALCLSFNPTISSDPQSPAKPPSCFHVAAFPHAQHIAAKDAREACIAFEKRPAIRIHEHWSTTFTHLQRLPSHDSKLRLESTSTIQLSPPWSHTWRTTLPNTSPTSHTNTNETT